MTGRTVLGPSLLPTGISGFVSGCLSVSPLWTSLAAAPLHLMSPEPCSPGIVYVSDRAPLSTSTTAHHLVREHVRGLEAVKVDRDGSYVMKVGVVIVARCSMDLRFEHASLHRHHLFAPGRDVGRRARARVDRSKRAWAWSPPRSLTLWRESRSSRGRRGERPRLVAIGDAQCISATDAQLLPVGCHDGAKSILARAQEICGASGSPRTGRWTTARRDSIGR